MDDHEFSMDATTVKPIRTITIPAETVAVIKGVTANFRASEREEMFSKLNVLCNTQIHLKNELTVVTNQIEVMEKLIETDYSK